MIKNESSLPEIIKTDISALIEKFSHSQFADNIEKLILFGSFASKKYQPDSDIDIAVVVKNRPEKQQLADYYLLTDNVGRDTDLLFCTEEQLQTGKYVYSEILREGVTVYENI